MDSIWNLWNYVEYVESTWNLWGSVKYTAYDRTADLCIYNSLAYIYLSELVLKI